MIRLASILGLAVVIAGCGDSGKSAPGSSAKPSNSGAASAATPAPKPTEMPPVTVDDMGIFLAGERANLKESDGITKLKRVIATQPIEGKEVKIIALKKASSTDVSTLIRELSAAGAPRIRIQSEGRPDLPKELVVVPADKYKDKPAACSIVAMISENLATDVWAVRGGTGKRHVKGFAGPDLSNTGESLKKDLKKCDSKVAFFSVDPSLDWELAHMIGGAILANDEEKKIDTLVLLDEPPVPGRAVKGFGE